MKSIDNILKEILQHPNEDMLIIRPSLFYYTPIQDMDQLKKEGIKKEGNCFHCFFQRIPVNIEDYKETLQNYNLIKISLSKLKRLKDQDVSLLSKNIPGYDDDQKLSIDDIKKLCQKTNLLTKYLLKGYHLRDVPSCILSLSDGFLPSWIYKVIEDLDE